MFNRSDPCLRDITTMILKPRLASHAPIVSIINANVEIFIIPVKYKHDGSIRTILSIIPSKHSRVISKWVRWRIKVSVATIYAIIK